MNLNTQKALRFLTMCAISAAGLLMIIASDDSTTLSPIPPNTCNGAPLGDGAAEFVVFTKHRNTLCSAGTYRYFANSEMDAKGCAERDHPAELAVDQLCQFFIRSESNGQCVAVTEILAESSMDAISCSSSSCADCLHSDITNQVTNRPASTCIGSEDPDLISC